MILDILASIFSPTFLAAILRITTPLLFASLGALVSERAGVINIGLEGIMLMAAFAGATAGAFTQSLWIGLAAGMLAATLLALLLAFFHLSLHGDLILGGVAINILGAAGSVALGYQITGGRAGGVIGLRPVRVPDLQLAFLRDIPLVGEAVYAAVGDQNAMTWLAALSAVWIWLLLYRTPLGRHLRAAGESPEAAASVGISIRRMRFLALALSGVLAGLGGMHLSMGYLSGFSRDMTAGRGYIALVVPALGNNTPGGTAIAALLFGAFAALETRLGTAAIPSQIPQMIPYLATLVALVLYALQRRRVAERRRAAALTRLQQAHPAHSPAPPTGRNPPESP